MPGPWCIDCHTRPATPRGDRCWSCARRFRRKAYGLAYIRARAALHLEDNPPCYWCGDTATTADHYPPLSHYHTPPEVPELVPACTRCNTTRRAATTLALQQQRRQANARIRSTTQLLERQRSWHPSQGPRPCSDGPTPPAPGSRSEP